MSEIGKALDAEILRELEYLKLLEPGSEEHTNVRESISQLYKLRLEEIKNDQNYELKQSEQKIVEKQHDVEKERVEADREAKTMQAFSDNTYRDADLELKREQLVVDKKDRWLKIGITAFEIAVPLAFYAFWLVKGFKFEETGTFTSTTFKNFIGKFKPTKL